MAKAVATIILSYNLDESFEGDEADIREEVRLWRDSVTNLIRRENLKADIEDITVEIA